MTTENQPTGSGIEWAIRDMNVRHELDQITTETSVEVVEELARGLDERLQRSEARVAAIRAASEAAIREHGREIMAAQLDYGWHEVRVDMGIEAVVVAKSFGFGYPMPLPKDSTQDSGRISLRTRPVSGRWQHHSEDVGEYGESILYYSSEPGVVPAPVRVRQDMHALIRDGGGYREIDLPDAVEPSTAS